MSAASAGNAEWQADQWAAAICRGDRAALARGLNLLEDRRPRERIHAAELLRALPEDRLRESGHLVGITGPPGAGKSSIAAELIRAWRRDGRSVGVLAVDPSSPISGGALLGDRLRMLQPVADNGVFIRSLATRGQVGGLSADVAPMSMLLLCAFDVVVVETVGIGQTEVDVALHTDTICLVAQPASGDTIQFLKAGVMEIPDVIAVNKADLGAPSRKAAAEIQGALARDSTGWLVPVVLVSATEQQGIDQLVTALEHHRQWLAEQQRLTPGRIAQRGRWCLKCLRDEFGSFGLEQLGGEQQLLAQWSQQKRSPYEYFEELRGRLLAQWNQTRS
jgi:GTPase